MEQLHDMKIIVYPYAEVKETLDKLAKESIKRTVAELAEKYAQEQAA